MNSPVLTGLPPIVGGNPRLLILGNMPSVMSLAAQHYYGNPQNAFWRVMGALYGLDPDGPYELRVTALVANGVAVWDVLRSCRRVGSLDSAVERDSMVANDFASFFHNHPIDRAGVLQRRRRRGQLPPVDRPSGTPLIYRRLPSTSPAHTVPVRNETGRVAGDRRPRAPGPGQ